MHHIAHNIFNIHFIVILFKYMNLPYQCTCINMADNIDHI